MRDVERKGNMRVLICCDDQEFLCRGECRSGVRCSSSSLVPLATETAPSSASGSSSRSAVRAEGLP